MFLYRPRRQFSISFLASHAATFSLFFYLYIVFVFRGLCSLEEPLKTRVCFRYPAVDFPANNRVTTVTPNETVLNEIFLIITLTHWIHLVGRNCTYVFPSCVLFSDGKNRCATFYHIYPIVIRNAEFFYTRSSHVPNPLI